MVYDHLNVYFLFLLTYFKFKVLAKDVHQNFGKEISSTASVADPGCLSRIPDPDFYPSRIPDPGSQNSNKRVG
jgi:hypothetical protein